MSSTQLTTFIDMATDLIQRVRDQTTDSTTLEIAKRYVNIGLHDMHVGQAERFHWTHRRGVIITHPSYSTGTAQVFSGSTSVIGTGTAWADENDFDQDNVSTKGRILIGGQVYEISQVASDTSLTLASKYTAESDSGLAYTYYEDAYDLASDFLRPLDVKRFSETPRVIDLMSRTEFRRRYPENSRTGRPQMATIIDEAPVAGASERRRVLLHPAPDDTYRIEYLYATSHFAVDTAGGTATNLVSDDDQPIVPLRYRHAILLHALYHYYRDRKDDARSQEARAEYTDLVIRIMNDSEIGSQRPVIAPRVGFYRNRARRPWNGSGSRRFDVGERFDRMID